MTDTQRNCSMDFQNTNPRQIFTSFWPAETCHSFIHYSVWNGTTVLCEHLMTIKKGRETNTLLKWLGFNCIKSNPAGEV